MSDSTPHDDLRDRAIHRLKAKQAFWYALSSWIVFSVIFVVIWLATGAHYFWPVWPIAGWGIGVVFAGINAFGPGRGAPSESRIQDEIRRLQ